MVTKRRGHKETWAQRDVVTKRREHKETWAQRDVVTKRRGHKETWAQRDASVEMCVRNSESEASRFCFLLTLDPSQGQGH